MRWCAEASRQSGGRSPGRLLEYNVPNVLSALSLTRDHPIVLEAASKDDHDPEIASLDSAANFKIVKELDGKGEGSYITTGQH